MVKLRRLYWHLNILTAKHELQRVWNDPETKKEALSKLEKVNKGVTNF